MEDLWQQIGTALRADFSDLADAGQVTHLVVRLILASLLGGLLGWQRERVGKTAGLRTHMLVAVGAAFFVFAPQQSGMSNTDLSRIIQGVTAGIGFIGAGTILRTAEREARIEGLTTAASIWLTAAVGVAVGLGREATAVLGTLLALAILSRVQGVQRGGPGMRMKLMDRIFKRHFSAGLTPAQPPGTPLTYLGGNVARRLHPAPPCGMSE